MNTELTPREHAEMRDTILAGAQRIHANGQRRMQLVAASVAFVLVAGISGGAVATAAIVGAGVDRGPVATPTDTLSPSPSTTVAPDATPTVTATTAEQSGDAVMPFGGDCANALTVDEVSAVVGPSTSTDLHLLPTGESEVLGGLTCWWSDPVNVRMSLHVYPSEVVPSAYLEPTYPTACAPRDGWASEPCRLRFITDSVWISLEIYPGLDDPTDGDALGALVVERLAAHQKPKSATPTEEWWRLPSCVDLDESLDLASAFGSSTQRIQPEQAAAPDGVSRLPDRAGAKLRCSWLLGSAEGEVVIRVIPGGGTAFDRIAASEGAEPVDVAGATSAVTAMDAVSSMEYTWVLAATDGTNLVVVQTSDYSSSMPRAKELGPITEEIIRVLSGQ